MSRLTFEEYWKSRVDAYISVYPNLQDVDLKLIQAAAHNAWISGQLAMLEKLPEPDIEYPDED